MEDQDLSPLQRGVFVVLAIAETPFLAAWIGGMWVAVTWRPAIYVALAGMTGRFLVHLAQGILMYRIVMTRPWPEVEPLDDD